MLKKVVLTLLALTLASFAIAGTLPGGGNTYKITLMQASVVNGMELKPGDYKLNVVGEKLTIVSSKQTVEIGVKVENSDSKFEHTAVRYTVNNGKQSIAEIRIGGTTTKLVFNP
jgi:hypothetical protein